MGWEQRTAFAPRRPFRRVGWRAAQSLLILIIILRLIRNVEVAQLVHWREQRSSGRCGRCRVR
jgi:hypothetical protein